MACSGLHFEREPLPDAAVWREIIPDFRDRLTTGLRAIYDWYERNEMITACILRDAEIHPLTREIIESRFLRFARAWQKVLGGRLSAKQNALLQLGLSFYTWRSLVRDAGLKQSTAVDAMVHAVVDAKKT